MQFCTYRKFPQYTETNFKADGNNQNQHFYLWSSNCEIILYCFSSNCTTTDSTVMFRYYSIKLAFLREVTQELRNAGSCIFIASMRVVFNR